MGLGSSLGLSTEVGGGAIAGEEAANQRLEDGVEDNLGTAMDLVSSVRLKFSLRIRFL